MQENCYKENFIHKDNGKLTNDLNKIKNMTKDHKTNMKIQLTISILKVICRNVSCEFLL